MSLRQRGIKLQRKNAGGRKSQQHPYHPHPKPSSVQSTVGGAHQESVSIATNEHERIDHQASQQFSSARNKPLSLDVHNNRTKFQLHWIRTLNFQLRLFDTTGQ